MKILFFSLIGVFLVLPTMSHASELDALIKETNSARNDPTSKHYIAGNADMYSFEIRGNQEIVIGNNGVVSMDDKGIDYDTGHSQLYTLFYPQTVYDETYDEVYWRKALPLYRYAQVAGIRDRDSFVKSQIDMPPRPSEPDIDRFPTYFTGIKKAQVLCAATVERLEDNGLDFTLHHLTTEKLPCSFNP